MQKTLQQMSPPRQKSVFTPAVSGMGAKLDDPNYKRQANRLGWAFCITHVNQSIIQSGNLN